MAGFEFGWVGFSEIDKYAIKVYEKNFPEAHNLGDITKIDGTKYKNIDLITGGFPCQDISVAGKGEGITGKRSGLWKEMFRLICEIRPRFVIVENVPALLGRGLGVVLGDLAQGGYDAEWDCIPAQAVGAPHRRDRVWIVAYTIGLWKSQQKRSEQDKWKWSFNGSKKRDVSDTTSQRCGQGQYNGQKHKDNLAEIGQSKENKQSGHIGECRVGKICENVAYTDKFNDDSSRFHTGTISQQQKIKVSGCEKMAVANPFSCIEKRDNIWWPSGFSWWELEPEEAIQYVRERGRKEVWVPEPESQLGRVADGIPNRVDRLKCLGNAVVPQVVAFIGERLLEVIDE